MRVARIILRELSRIRIGVEDTFLCRIILIHVGGIGRKLEREILKRLPQDRKPPGQGVFIVQRIPVRISRHLSGFGEAAVGNLQDRPAHRQCIGYRYN